MDNLNDMLDDTEDGFENLDTLFPSTNETTDDEDDDINNEEESVVVEKPKARRGRPPKKKVEEEVDSDLAEEKPKVKRAGRKKKIEEEPTKEEKPKKESTKQEKVDVSDFPIEVIDKIFQSYSQISTNKLAKTLEITEAQIKETIKILDELFQLSISTGDLTVEDFEEKIAPKLKPYGSKTDNFKMFVNEEIRSLENNEEDN